MKVNYGDTLKGKCHGGIYIYRKNGLYSVNNKCTYSVGWLKKDGPSFSGFEMVKRGRAESPRAQIKRLTSELAKRDATISNNLKQEAERLRNIKDSTEDLAKHLRAEIDTARGQRDKNYIRAVTAEETCRRNALTIAAMKRTIELAGEAIKVSQQSVVV